ncbi:MAG: CHAT domain-containing protein, partial [Bacteroidota bacterium]
AFRKRTFGERHPLTGACNNFLARTYARRGEREKALTAFQLSMQILSDSSLSLDWRTQPSLPAIYGYEKYQIEALLGKARLLWDWYQTEVDPQKLEVAASSIDIAAAYIDQFRQSHLLQANDYFWSKLAFPVYELGIATALESFQQTSEKRYFETAFHYSEKSRAYQLLVAAQSEKAQQISGLPEALLQKERSLLAGIQEYQAKVGQEQQRCEQGRPKNLDLWQKAYLRLQSEYQEHLSMLERDFPAYYGLKFQLPQLSLEEVQASLSDSSLLIEYFFGDSSVYMFAIGNDRFEVTEHQPQALRQSIAQFCLLLRDYESYLQAPDKQYEAFIRLGSSLGEKLIAPLVTETFTSDLLLIPSGPLLQLPFAALLYKSPEAKRSRDYLRLPYLIQRYSIRYASSASLLLGSIEQSERRAKLSALAFAPDYQLMSSQLPSLPNSQAEIAQVQALLGGRSLKGSQASESQFYSLAPQARILHLASHAIVDPEEAALSHFVLHEDVANDGRLHAYELLGIRLKAELAILSACNTGSGELVLGEGIMSLGRAFQYAGCPALLTSLWRVEDEATTQLMGLYYQQLKLGKGKAKALREAQIHYLHQADPVQAHPFFWAGFIMIGEGAPLSGSGPSPYWWLLLVFPILGGMWWMRRKGLTR